MTDDPHAPLKDPLKDPLVDPPHALMVCMRGVRRACLHVRMCWGGLGYRVGLKKLPPLSSATLSRASSAAAAGGVKVRDDTTPRATPCSTFDTTGAETPPPTTRPPLPDPHPSFCCWRQRVTGGEGCFRTQEPCFRGEGCVQAPEPGFRPHRRLEQAFKG